MKLIENIGKLSTLDMIEATLEPLHPFPNWVLNHDLNVHSVLFDSKLPYFVLKPKKCWARVFRKIIKL